MVGRAADEARGLAIRAGVVEYRPSVWDARRWETAYGSGALDYFGGLDERARYSVLVGYLGWLTEAGERPAIVDVGCGPALLRTRTPDEWIGRYVGVDPTEAAIEQARRLELERSTFVVGTAADVRDDGPFDVVVCNEVLEMVDDAGALVDDLRALLRPGGHVLTSIWRHPGDHLLWRALDDRLQRVDRVHVRNERNPIGRRGWLVGVHQAT